MPFCGNCGSELKPENKFCIGCGKPVSLTVTPSLTNQHLTTATAVASPSEIIPLQNEPMLARGYDRKMLETKKEVVVEEEASELEFYRGVGELIIKRTEHRGAARKTMGIIAGLATFGVGYVIVGKDKTRKSRAEGSIVITNKAIYVAGNDYPFDRIISITKQGRISKSIVITFESDVQAGGRASGSIAATGGLSIEAEIKTEDIDGLFAGLEKAKLHKIRARY
jgi:hypothetical protein